MHKGVNPRRITGALAAMTIAAGGIAAFPGTAAATDRPAVTLDQRVVTITGTPDRDVIRITVDANRLAIDFGFDGTVDAQFRRSTFDQVRVLGAGGDDGIGLTGAGEAPVTIAGGAGDDGLGAVGHIGETGDGDAPTVINGNGGRDGIFAATPGPVALLGGPGNDVVDGGGAGVGLELVALGDGNDRFRSSLNAFVGPRTDIVDGGTGTDSLEMEGTFATEGLSLSADAGRLVVNHDFHDRIDADNVETVSYLGLGGLDGGDAIAVNDLSGTDVQRFTNLGTNHDGSAPNNTPDTLTVRGTDGVDHITVASSGTDITVTGLTPTVSLRGVEPEDFLRIETLAGNDVVDSRGLAPGLVHLLAL